MTTASHRLRLLFVSEAYPPTSGGVATSTQRIAQNLVRQGCEVLVLTFDGTRPLAEDDYLVEEDDHGVVVKRIGPFFLKQPSVEAERLSEKIRAVFRRRAFDQMERLAHDFGPAGVLSFYVVNAGLFGTYLSRSLGIPHIAGVRGNDIGRNIFSLDRLAAVRMVIESATHVVCVNGHLAKRLHLAFPQAGAFTSVIMNGLELPFDEAPAATRDYLHSNAGWPDSDPVAVFIGTPREKKGIGLLLRAIESARERVPLRLLIVGPGLGAVERRQCGDSWDRLAASGALHQTGQRDRSTALRIAAEGDIVVMPSIEDGMANGLLEGMALGLAPIVTDLFSDVVPSGDAGWVVQRNSVPALAAALVNAGESSEIRQSRARTAREIIRMRHSPAREAAAYLSLFQNFTNGK